jgi:hypothetical protein
MPESTLSRSFVATLLRVLAMQAVALGLLALLQLRYGR